jgi:hypothetical protein
MHRLSRNDAAQLPRIDGARTMMRVVYGDADR